MRPIFLPARSLVCAVMFVPAIIAAAATPCLPSDLPSLSLATGAPGGGFYDYGRAVAEAAATSGKLLIETRETSGTIDNIKLVESGQTDCGLAVIGPAYEAWNGLEAWTAGKRYLSFRAVAPMYETTFHAMAPKTAGVRTLADFKTRRLGVGPHNGTGELMFERIAEVNGLQADIVMGTPAEQVEQLVKGDLDGIWFGAGLPIPAFEAASLRLPVDIIGLTRAERDAAIKRMPYLSPSVVPSATYRGQTADVDSIGVWNIVVCRESVDADRIERLLSVLFDHNDRLRGRFAPAAETAPANAAKANAIPYHASAIADYARRGISLPLSHF